MLSYLLFSLRGQPVGLLPVPEYRNKLSLPVIQLLSNNLALYLAALHDIDIRLGQISVAIDIGIKGLLLLHGRL